MELKALKYFKAIVEEGSFTAAAEALHLTQPTLSRQIAQLESELGNDLIIRSGRNTEVFAFARLSPSLKHAIKCFGARPSSPSKPRCSLMR